MKEAYIVANVTGLAEVDEHANEGIDSHELLEKGRGCGGLQTRRHVSHLLEKNGGTSLLR